jgi:uncharacterized coiled-coil DUF342 family protein
MYYDRHFTLPQGNEVYKVWSYNLETVLAEKIETIAQEAKNIGTFLQTNIRKEKTAQKEISDLMNDAEAAAKQNKSPDYITMLTNKASRRRDFVMKIQTSNEKAKLLQKALQKYHDAASIVWFLHESSIFKCSYFCLFITYCGSTY